jgi:SAM-dependent methyltransferase
MKDVTDAWDKAGKAGNHRRAIHPLGNDAEAYETSGQGAAQRLAEVIGDLEAITTVVDFGAGDGRVAIPLARLGYPVTAVDASLTMVRRLKAFDPTFPAIVADGSNLEDLPQPVDVVYALAVLIHHRHADAAIIITNLAASLKPGGRLLLDLPLYDVGREPGAWCDVSTWTLPELLELADRLGLTVERAEVSPGAFSFDAIGPSHGDLVILRAP